MDQMDPPEVGGYTGLTRKLVIDDNQKNSFKKLLNEGGLVPGKSKLKLNGMGIKLHFLLGLTLTILRGLQRRSRHMAQKSRHRKHVCYYVGNLVGGGGEVDAFGLGGRIR